MHTEEEAENVFCHYAFMDNDNVQKCVGPKCMAWRWGGDKWVDSGGGAGMHLQKAGYCGLAGKPDA